RLSHLRSPRSQSLAGLPAIHSSDSLLQRRSRLTPESVWRATLSREDPTLGFPSSAAVAWGVHDGVGRGCRATPGWGGGGDGDEIPGSRLGRRYRLRGVGGRDRGGRGGG